MSVKTYLLSGSNVLAFFSVDRALAASAKIPGSVTATTEEQLADWPTAALVRIHNEVAETPVKKFRDAATARERVWPLLDKVAVIPEAEQEAEAVATEKKPARRSGKKDTTPAPVPAPVKQARERTAQWAGKTIIQTVKGTDAKRRPDTRRTASWNLITKGMKFEEYLKAGGRLADLDKMFRLDHIRFK